MAKQIENKKENLVLGRVVDRLNRPLANLIVQAYDRDMRSEELLGECITDRDGKYEIGWSHSQLSGRGKKTADIVIKVITREKKTLLFTSDMDAVRFNASPREEINVAIETAIKPEVVEYDYILKQVTYLAGKVAITDLQESKEHRDITFLSKEAEIPAEKIEHLVVAHRLQAESRIDAAFFYALLRKNTLLKNDLAKPFHARLSIDINTEPLPLLYDAALVEEKTIQQDIKTAVEEMLVSAKVERESNKNIDMLRAYRKQAEEYYRNEHPRKLMRIISRFVLEDKIGEMGRIFEENKDNPGAFFTKINSEIFFETAEKVNEAQASIALEELLGFENTLITQIKESHKIKKPEDLKRLAKLNRAAWKEELTKLTARTDIAGKPLDTTSIDLLASSIVRKMEKAYPTAAFAAQLEREKKPVLKNHKEIIAFLSKHEDFDLQHDNISIYLKDKKLTKKDSEAIREELETVQRIFKLVPHYGKTNALRKLNIHSSYSITSAGETRFVHEIAPKAGIAPKEAKEIFKRAERTTTAAMMIAGELQDTLRTMHMPAMEMKTLSLKLEAVSEDFPNLKSLFKLTDTCSCGHCRSVYSPAAYLVEILQFLDKRSVTDLTTTPPTTAHLAKDVLFERRPDLGEIDLSCENANTPVPYIDLVCELLEDTIAPDAGVNFTGVLSDGADPLKGKISNGLFTTLEAAGLPVTDQALIFETETTTGSAATLPHYLRDKKVVCKIINTGGNNYQVFRLRQTLSPAEELAAAPEYVNAVAYNTLKTTNYAFKLPFDLDHTEAKAYFTRFDISRAKLMEDFQSAGNPTDEAIAAERLGLTDAERNLIVTPKANLVDQQAYWNAPAQWDTPPVMGDVLDYMTRVDHFLDKTGLTYKDLDLLLSLRFIDLTKNLFIKHLDINCDTAKKEIANLNEAALDRIHRFLRLQKKTGWRLEVIDEIISQTKLGNGTLNDACLVKAANLLKLSEKTGIKIDELIGFYGEIPHTILKDDAPKPLYQQIFLNKAKNGFIDEGLLPEKVDGTQLLSNFITSIAVCLQIKEQDLYKLLPLLPDGNLSFSNLSSLFAASRLMRKMKLKADDYVMLTNLTGLNVSNSVTDTLDFVEAVNSLNKSPLKLADVTFMLQHEASNLADREIKDDKIKQILEKLQKDYQSNFSANKSLFNANMSAQEQKEILQNALSKLSTVGEEDVKTFIKFIDRDWTSANDAKTFTDNKLNGLFDTSSIKAKIDALAAAPGPDISSEQKDLVKAFLDSIAGYQLQAGKQAILEQTFATIFKADLELVKIALKYAILKQPAPGTSFLSDVLSADALIDVDITHTIPVLPAITTVAFPDQYRALRLAHKLFPLVNSFKLENQDVEWFFKNNKDLGWFEWDSIPYQTGQVAINYTGYIAFAEMIDLLKQLTPVPNPADAERPISFFTIAAMLLPASGATRNQFIEAFSLLTSYTKEDVDAIDAHLFPVFDLNNYKDAKAWKAISDCAEHLRKLGSTVVQVQAYINPVLTSAETNLLRTALKARYDEDTWLSTLKEIMNAIRPQKRDALVAYLLAENPEMKTENDLYDYFLVDVEMESCMPSSRIVQAHGTIQLFVQRCLMGLEPKAAADVNNDKAWEQWKWMKNYRVWEANRKVFVYPENWIEAELRDDKSFLFTELENELQQNELTEFTAEEALIRYLEKLDNIAFLEVMATWYQTDIKTMHVFARTKGGDPAIYYYRRFEKERYWTPWEKVELDITGDHLLAFERNNRLCLAWPVFSEEPDPNPQSTIPNSTAGTVVNNDKPKRKLKIQLAISEFANKKWQPKKISKDGLLVPYSYFTSDENLFKRDKYNLLYFELGQQVWLFSTSFEAEYINLNGIFTIAGCKGYPELSFQGDQSFPDFFPDFKDTWLKSQRYNEQNLIPADDLSVRNAISFFSFYEILGKTPGTFRLSYPHQFTLIDLVALLFEYLLMQAYGINSAAFSERRFIKIPLGTLLPYFKEDSKHAYAIVPGFYKAKRDENSDGEVYVQRTGSDVMQLIEDIISLFKKYMAKYAANPDINALLQELVADNDYQKIVNELKVYASLSYGEQFKNLYHPLICALRKTLYKDGIPELMKRETQLQKTSFNFEQYYDPNKSIVPKTYILEEAGIKTLSYPVEDLDFSSDGSYSGYNWELFFHMPFLLATRLTRNQRFEEALTWFHYMFNPTGALEGNVPEKYWVTKPFYQTHTGDYINQRIDTLLYKIADPNTPERKELEFAIDQWRTKPFKPHVVARFRSVAYQKALLMKYIDNLTEWGDYLFRQDTMESIVQATQMYILADKLLGPKPRIIPTTIKAPYETYNQIEAKLDAFGNALIGLENILPDLSVLPEGGAELPPPPITLSMLYFCIPQNEKMLEYWDRIADRLFKIRNCQNIEGVERSLALFAPPIDPGMLVRAAAAGLDISAVLAGINAPTPFYRFTVFAQKASELATDVRGLGISLLQALEKKDAEAMSLLRNELEIKVLNAIKDTKLLQIKESKEQIETLKRAKATAEERNKYYSSIQKIISKEQLNLDKLSESHDYQMAAQIIQATAGVLALIPDFAIGASGFGGSPHAAAKWGGTFLAHAATAASGVLTVLSTAASYEANRASILGGYDRRFDDWKLQERLAKKEMAQIDKQIVAAEIRKEIAEADLKSHELQIENSKMATDFMNTKFTNKELYDWMIGQISAVYFKSYQLAHDFAKKAERCYRFELGNDDAFISYGYWDSMKKGLQSADNLIYDIKRMQASYLDKNKREYEITKHISLAQLDPLALVRLRATGVCDFDVPEVLYDMDHPGHYFRRIKLVSISLPCVVGPYTSVSAKLSLVNNRYRKNTNPDNIATTGYLEDPGNDERFIYNVGSIQSLAASNAQNDNGMFELNFRDERYLPFEGCGAISTWRLELPKEVRQFDYNTISDVILHIKYTAREGGSTLRGLAETSLKDRLNVIKQQLSQTGLHIALNMKHDLTNEWLLLKNNGTVNLKIDKSRLPYMAQTIDASIENVMFVAKVKNNPANFSVEIDGNSTNLSRVNEWKLCRGNNSNIDLDTSFALSVAPGQLNNLEELMMVVKYSF
ncbi:MAG: neuraminidase-like domain-containing protein [Candidatus Jettenia sp.]|nr:neuraminidase-like domain-containing protein [Candidatus Jettenia sp.]